MPNERTERWKELCAQAASEQDPDKLLALVKEINRLLDDISSHGNPLGKPESA
jgi:flagellin-like hook-associated protein FlgL